MMGTTIDWLLVLYLSLWFARLAAPQEIRSCSTIRQHFSYANFTNDTSWSNYLDSVYGADRPSISKVDVNFLYKYSPVNIRAHDWGHKRPLSALQENWGESYFHYSSKVYSDNQWAEVTRYSTNYLNMYKKRDAEWEEGLSRGFPGRSPHNETKVGYGCWFNLARGSGIFVNVGRTLVTPDKYHSSLFHDLGLTSKGCLQTDQTGDNCYDRYICTAALQQGYDSVQVTDHSEMIICSGKCATDSLKGACPPVEVRNGYFAKDVCNCDDRLAMLNCGAGEHDRPRLVKHFSTEALEPAEGADQHNISISSPLRRTTCISRSPPSSPYEGPFNLTLAFTAGILSHTEILTKVRASVTSLGADYVLLVDVGNVASGDSASRRFLRGALQHHHSPHEGGHRRLDESDERNLRDHSRHHHVQSPQNFPHRHHQEGEEEIGHHVPDDEQHHHHHHHHHEDHRHEPSTRLPVSEALKETGYRALGWDLAAPPLESSHSLPVLSGTHHALHCSTLLRVGNIKVGVVAYHPSPLANENIAKIVDEAMCVRYMGANIVVLMVAQGLQLPQDVVLGSKQYIDLIIGTDENNTASPCQGGTIDATNSNQMHLKIDRSKLEIGVVRVAKGMTETAFVGKVLAVV